MPYHTFQLRIKADQVAPPPNAHRLRWMASHWMLSRLRLLALQFACSPLARFAGLPTQGSVSLDSQSPTAPCESSSLATPEGAASLGSPSGGAGAAGD